MWTHLFSGDISPSIEALLVFCVAVTAILRAWIGYRQIIVRERARTRRLNLALKGVRPEHRSKIISACGELEKDDGSGRDGKPSVKANSKEDDLCAR